MKVCVIVLAAFINIGVFSGSAWEIAVAVRNEIEFMNMTGEVVGRLSEGLNDVEALAYNAELGHLYILDNTNDGSIFQLSVPINFTGGNQTVGTNVIVTKKDHMVRWLAYDDMTGILYWTEKIDNSFSIMFVQVQNVTGKAQSGQKLLSLDKGHIPYSLAIDTCQRFLYWSYKIDGMDMGAVERVRLDPSLERTVVVQNDLKSPNAVVVDQLAGKLYWVDEKPGMNFHIETSDLDGYKRQSLYNGTDHQPFKLTVSGDDLLWVDHTRSAVWALDTRQPSATPRRIVTYSPIPGAIVSAHAAQWQRAGCRKVFTPHVEVTPATVTELSKRVCLHGGQWKEDRGSCVCLKGYTGISCEVMSTTESSQNLVSETSVAVCLNGGRMPAGQSLCECPRGFSGVYCEIKSTMKARLVSTTKESAEVSTSEAPKEFSEQAREAFIHPICLHGGRLAAGQTFCDCPQGYSGMYCEVDECEDFCLNNGQCQVKEGRPSCSCPTGYSGERCHLPSCHNYCVFGHCTIDLQGQPQCHCTAGYTGPRCEVNYTQQQSLNQDMLEVCQAFCSLWTRAEKNSIQPFHACSCSEEEGEDADWWKPSYLIIAQFVLILLLMVLVACLAKKVMMQRKRPRIKKRFIVNKNVTPLTCRPTANGDQCEITIENCCNMNICETVSSNALK